ncbi:MAG: hypothetical protein HYV28_17480 [Ignavibacteriales bacterium]|nr:hypothetical protein [Ignavibacteriales bacterium]
MLRHYVSVLFIIFLVICNCLQAQVPSLPEGALTRWVVDDPEEVVSYLLFDPKTVKERLPEQLRFITIKELADGNTTWAKDQLAKFPGQEHWCISFIEIVRMKEFSLDGREPAWPANGAAAIWFARVAASDSLADLGSGKPFLALDFWMPDSAFVSYMVAKGHYARYGNVTLQNTEHGMWIGTIEADGLHGTCSCFPEGAVDRSGSKGMQLIFAPALSGVTNYVRIAFAGHKEQLCDEKSFWKFEGDHPLVNGVLLGPTSFQFGYDMVGGSYLMK